MKKKTSPKNNPATQKDIKLLREDLELMGGNLTFQIDEVRQEHQEASGKTNKRFDKLEEENRGLKKSIDNNTVRLSKLEDIARDMKKSIDLNTEATTMLTKEFREIKHIEFQVYNHENRITKLEAR